MRAKGGDGETSLSHWNVCGHNMTRMSYKKEVLVLSSSWKGLKGLSKASMAPFCCPTAMSPNLRLSFEVRYASPSLVFIDFPYQDFQSMDLLGSEMTIERRKVAMQSVEER